MATPPLPPSDNKHFVDWIGIEQLSVADGMVQLKLVPQAYLLNRRAFVHGGILATLLDSAMARAAESLPGVAGLGGTVDLHIQYMQPASGTLMATGQIQHASKTLAFCRGEVHNEMGELLASAMGTFRLRRAADNFSPPFSD